MLFTRTRLPQLEENMNAITTHDLGESHEALAAIATALLEVDEDCRIAKEVFAVRVPCSETGGLSHFQGQQYRLFVAVNDPFADLYINECVSARAPYGAALHALGVDDIDDWFYCIELENQVTREDCGVYELGISGSLGVILVPPGWRAREYIEYFELYEHRVGGGDSPDGIFPSGMWSYAAKHCFVFDVTLGEFVTID